MRGLLLSTMLALSAASVSAGAAGRPIVLELFTSEGCSSCPPADALLTALSDRRDLLPLTFHVTYWNGLGWRDPFSLEAATHRQAEYAIRLGGGSYTPEMVVDGRRGMVGSDGDAVAAAITAARAEAAAAAMIEVARSSEMLSVAIGRGMERGEVLLIGYDPRHETKVGRGENGGRTLVETNVVRSIRRIADYVGEPIKLVSPAGPGARVAVLVQAPDGRILAAGRP